MGFNGSADKPPVSVEAVQSVSTFVAPVAYADITGCSITLSEPGRYIIQYSGRGRAAAVGLFVLFRLFNVTAAAAIADTETLADFVNGSITLTDSQSTSSSGTFLDVTTPVTITLQAQGSSASNVFSLSNTTGRTKMFAHRI